MEIYDIFVFCGGKCDGCTLTKTFIKNGYKAIHYHGINYLGLFSCKNKKIPCDELINYNLKTHKVYIIDSYRNPIERKNICFFSKY